MNFEGTGKLMDTLISKPNTTNFNTLNRQDLLVIVAEALTVAAPSTRRLSDRPESTDRQTIKTVDGTELD